jgi:hypothetical protein
VRARAVRWVSDASPGWVEVHIDPADPSLPGSAGRGRGDDVHEHAGSCRGDVQRPGPDRPPPVQRQGDAETGEDQGGGVGNRGLRPGHDSQTAAGVDHRVLRGEAHRGRRRGQRAKPDGGITEPEGRPVAREHRPDRPACLFASRVCRARRPRSVRDKFSPVTAGGTGTAGQLMSPSPLRGRCEQEHQLSRGLHGRFLPKTGCMLCREWQDAAPRQDAVTTRQDQRWTRGDAPAKVKPSLHVLRTWVKCRTRGCERSC